ncbi:MAG: HEAT repeat domain-containing protein [Planctomycetota bacterium]|jgi:HEAT repeat protein
MREHAIEPIVRMSHRLREKNSVDDYALRMDIHTLIEFKLIPRAGSEGLAVLEALLKSEDLELRRHVASLFPSRSDGQVRAAALTTLASSGAPHVARLIIPLLEDPEERVRAKAVHILGCLADPEAVPPLVSIAAGQDPRLAREAVQVLGWIGDPGAVVTLLSILNDPNAEPSLREASARSLGEIGDPRAADALLAFVREAPCGAAVGALGWLRCKAAVGTLCELLDHEDVYLHCAA